MNQYTNDIININTFIQIIITKYNSNIVYSFEINIINRLISNFFIKINTNQNTLIKLNDSKYNNIEFRYPENYRKMNSKFLIGVFGVESPDFKIQPTSFGRQIEFGAEIKIAEFEPIILLTPDDWIEQVISNKFLLNEK